MEQLRNHLRNEVDNIQNTQSVPFDYQINNDEAQKKEILNKEFENLKKKIQDDMIQDQNQYNQEVEDLSEAAKRFNQR